MICTLPFFIGHSCFVIRHFLSSLLQSAASTSRSLDHLPKKLPLSLSEGHLTPSPKG